MRRPSMFHIPFSDIFLFNGMLSAENCMATLSSLSLKRLVTLLALAVCAHPDAMGQKVQAITPPEAAAQKDQQAILIISTALLNLGSVPAHCQVTGIVTSADGQSAGTFDFESNGSGFRMKSNQGEKQHVFDTTSGSPVDTSGGNASTSFRYHQFRAFFPPHLPAYILGKAINDSNWQVSYLGMETVNGRTLEHIAVSDESDPISKLVSPQQWWFDSSTGSPVRVRFRLPGSTAEDYVEAEVDYTSFAFQGSYKLPTSYELVINDSVKRTFTIESSLCSGGGR